MVHPGVDLEGTNMSQTGVACQSVQFATATVVSPVIAQ